MKRLKEIEAKLKPKHKKAIAIWSHPHRQSLKYYRHRVGLTRALNRHDVEWLNANTQGPYSQDYTIAPHNISFANADDAILFKLTWGGSLACAPHVKL